LCGTSADCPCTFDQAEALDSELSATETLERAAPDAELQDIKALLGRMLFSGRAAHKKVLLHIECCLLALCLLDLAMQDTRTLHGSRFAYQAGAFTSTSALLFPAALAGTCYLLAIKR
jgi:hypothetical protein